MADAPDKKDKIQKKYRNRIQKGDKSLMADGIEKAGV